jgi:hypothetical protein
MTTNIKHSWTKYDNIMVSIGYLIGISPFYMAYILYYIPQKSIEMKFKNCLYLQKGNVEGSLKHASKEHVKVWKFIYGYNLIFWTCIVLGLIIKYF